MKVQLIKLISGEEVLSRTEVKSGTYVLQMPVTIVPGETTITFEPFMPYASSDEFRIDKQNVMFACTPTAALTDHYLKTTSPLDITGTTL
tara:strand:+ start:2088 stop:2357 length:270 start_codon:yes stop_codon:yes gene_type:complete